METCGSHAVWSNPGIPNFIPTVSLLLALPPSTVAASQWLGLPVHLLCRVQLWFTLPRLSCFNHPLLNSYSPSRRRRPNSKMQMPWWRAGDSNCFCEEEGDTKLSHLKPLSYFYNREVKHRMLTRQTCSTCRVAMKMITKSSNQRMPATGHQHPPLPGLNSSLAFITDLCFSVCVPRQNSLIHPVSESGRAV